MRSRRTSGTPALLGRFRRDGGDAEIANARHACLSFGGVNEYVTLDSLAPELFASQAWTVSMWLRHPGPTASGRNLWNVNTAAGGNVTTSTFIATNNYMTIYAGSSAVSAGRSNTTNLLDGEWHHLMIAVDHATNRLDWYVDGVLEQGAGATVFPALAADDLVTLGAEWDPGPSVGNFWDGDILGVAVWFEQLPLTSLAPAIHAAGPALNLRKLNPAPDRWYILGGLGFDSMTTDIQGSTDTATAQNIVRGDVTGSDL